MMIDFCARVHNRYERPFAVILIKFLFPDAPQDLDQARTETMVWDIIRGAVRDVDLIAAMEHQLVLLLPETPPENASVVVERVNSRLAEATASSTHIQTEVVTEDQLPGLMDLLRNE